MFGARKGGRQIATLQKPLDLQTLNGENTVMWEAVRHCLTRVGAIYQLGRVLAGEGGPLNVPLGVSVYVRL